MIADKTTKLPLENVSIYNDKDNSTTNQEGLFVFVSGQNEINFNLLEITLRILFLTYRRYYGCLSRMKKR